MIKLVNVNKAFGDLHVIKDFSADFDQGKINMIIGQSGSGKTVLLKSIVGLHEIDDGEVLYNDRDFIKMNFTEKKNIRKEIGMLFQGSALFDSSTVEENVIFPMNMFTKMTSEEKKDRANYCLQRVNIVNANHLYPAEISGGMQKRVAIARAIALNPKYLFCDEPNSGLDPKTAIVIDNLIKNITEEFNITTIINTHDMNSIMEIGDKIIYLYKGEKWWEGNKEEIFDTENKELNEFVFASAFAKKVKNLRN